MPSLITHDTFGREVYEKMFEFIGGSRDEAQAFLLGNQGPDPLFYAEVLPHMQNLKRLGSLMHDEKPTQLLTSFKQAIGSLPEADRKIGRAYVMGFLCHYKLDSTAHPFIIGQELMLCDAGEPGLTRNNARDVHAHIETELDEVALFTKRGTTTADFNPAKNILQANDHVLEIISALYKNVFAEVYNITIPSNMFKTCTKAFRVVQGFFYSPTGLKRNMVGKVEMLARPYSFYRAMSHHNHELTESIFDNHEHNTWTNPFTEETDTASFWDLFNRAKEAASSDLFKFDLPSFGEEKAREITHDLNFSGKPTNARVIAVENL